MDRENDKTGLSLLRLYFLFEQLRKVIFSTGEKAHARQRKKSNPIVVIHFPAIADCLRPDPLFEDTFATFR